MSRRASLALLVATMFMAPMLFLGLLGVHHPNISNYDLVLVLCALGALGLLVIINIEERIFRGQYPGSESVLPSIQNIVIYSVFVLAYLAPILRPDFVVTPVFSGTILSIAVLLWFCTAIFLGPKCVPLNHVRVTKKNEILGAMSGYYALFPFSSPPELVASEYFFNMNTRTSLRSGIPIHIGFKLRCTVDPFEAKTQGIHPRHLKERVVKAASNTLQAMMIDAVHVETLTNRVLTSRDHIPMISLGDSASCVIENFSISYPQRDLQ
jgi:hypothetical protein